MRIVFNIGSSYTRFIIGVIAVFLLTPFILGVVGKEQFGLWSLCIAVTGVLGLLDMGLGTAVVKYVAECTGNLDYQARNEAISTLFPVYMILGGLCLLLILSINIVVVHQFGFDPQQTEVFGRVVTITGTALAVALPLSVFRSALIGFGRFDLVNLVETVCILINAVLVVILLSNNWGLTGLAIANASIMLAGPLILLPIAWRTIPEFHLSIGLIRLSRIGELAPLAMYFLLANVALIVTLRSDALIIKGFLPLSAVAAYAIAAKISEYSYLLNKQFSNALMPLISRATGAGDQRTVRNVLVDGTRFLTIIATPLLCLLFFHAEHVISIWVGPGFIDVVLPLRILLVAVLFLTLQLNAANVMGMSGGHRGVAWIMMGSALSNILLSVLLIPRMGIAGAAWSTLASACLLDFGFILSRACNELSVSRISMLKSVLPALFCAAPMLILAEWMNLNWPVIDLSDLLLQSMIATLLYGCVVFFTGLRQHERTWITNQMVRLLPRRPLRTEINEGNQHG